MGKSGMNEIEEDTAKETGMQEQGRKNKHKRNKDKGQKLSARDVTKLLKWVIILAVVVILVVVGYKLAKQLGMSVEEAGRKERYRIFNEACKGRNARIAVAHHMNDQAETVLMNLSRGTSLKGIGGIRPVRDNIIRPLLSVTRAEVEEVLKTLTSHMLLMQRICAMIIRVIL